MPRIPWAALPLLASFLTPLGAAADTPTKIFPLRDIKAGMKAVGRTVFSGDRVEDFQVEILGVLDNIGPKQNLILAKLSGGPLDHTGVLQGMSGSPVYIDGKLIGAVALAFPFSKDPIAGIRPIEEMLRVEPGPPVRPRSQAGIPNGNDALLAAMAKGSLLPFAKAEGAGSGEARMIEIATPVAFGGFSEAAIEHFAPALRSLGLEPRQGISSGGSASTKLGDPAHLKPGSMISVQLMSGDMSVGADGTVTMVEGNEVHAFGHRFLAIGPTTLPFSRAEVLTLLPNVNSSFKISASKELMGVITQDRSTAIAGRLGAQAVTLPLEITVTRGGHLYESYRMRMANDRLLSPFLVQMAVFSAVDATERTTGAESLTVRGTIAIDGQSEPVHMNDVYAGDAGSAALAALSTAAPLAYLMQGGFDSLKVKSIVLNIDASDTKKTLQVEQVLASKREVHPGDTVEIETLLTGDNDLEVRRSVNYKIPPGALPGTLYFTVADGIQTNFLDLRQAIAAQARSPRQLVDVTNRLRSNGKAYLRVWRSEAVYSAGGEDFPGAPPSAAIILSGGMQTANRNARLAEFEIDGSGMAVLGSKTVQVEVKE